MKTEASNNYTKYMNDKIVLRNKFSNMGLLNSGAYKSALESLDREYELSSKYLSGEIDKVEEQIAALEAEEASPTVEFILERIASNYDMSYEEAVQKYNKYIA